MIRRIGPFIKSFIGLCIIITFGLVSCTNGPSQTNNKTTYLAHPEAIPLALDPQFQFRKTKTFLLESNRQRNSNSSIRGRDKSRGGNEKALAFERKRLLFGAITAIEEEERFGNYFTFFWRAAHTANLKIRLEYRQANQGPIIHAKELNYTCANGSYQTDFEIVGKNYMNNGQVTAWRALIIEYNNRSLSNEAPHIVALTQSSLWQ